MKLALLIFVLFSFGCAVQNKRENPKQESATQVSTKPSVVYSSLNEVFQLKEDVPAISKLRVFKINRNSPHVKKDKDSSIKPYTIFKVGQEIGDSEYIYIKTSAISLELKKVGLASPRLFVSSKGNVTELKPEEFMHKSELGTCLTAYYSFNAKEHLKEGTKFIILNDADSFENSLGYISVDNPNLNLRQSVGFCTMVEIYPHTEATLEVTIK